MFINSHKLDEILKMLTEVQNGTYTADVSMRISIFCDAERFDAIIDYYGKPSQIVEKSIISAALHDEGSDTRAADLERTLALLRDVENGILPTALRRIIIKLNGQYGYSIKIYP